MAGYPLNPNLYAYDRGRHVRDPHAVKLRLRFTDRIKFDNLPYPENTNEMYDERSIEVRDHRGDVYRIGRARCDAACYCAAWARKVEHRLDVAHGGAL